MGYTYKWNRIARALAPAKAVEIVFCYKGNTHETRGSSRSPDDGHMNALMTSEEDPAANHGIAHRGREVQRRITGVKAFNSYR